MPFCPISSIATVGSRPLGSRAPRIDDQYTVNQLNVRDVRMAGQHGLGIVFLSIVDRAVIRVLDAKLVPVNENDLLSFDDNGLKFRVRRADVTVSPDIQHVGLLHAVGEEVGVGDVVAHMEEICDLGIVLDDGFESRPVSVRVADGQSLYEITAHVFLAFPGVS